MADAAVEKPRRRWFRLTPDRAVIALLALEGFLLLSDWFGWFAFDRHKGYAVLLTVAAVGLATVLLVLWFLAALVFRLRFQFSIRSLLLLPVVVAIVCGWLAAEMKQTKKQREAVEEIEKAGGRISYDNEFDLSGNRISCVTPPGLGWLCRLLGDDLFGNVCEVDFIHFVGSYKPQVNDAVLEHLKDHFKGLPQLRSLDVRCTEISDAGLEHVEGLTQLRELNLWNTKVSDAGLQHVKGLTQLHVLDLGLTRVTDAGLRFLKGLTQLQELNLWNTKVSDAGMQHVKGLTRLRWLEVGRTKVTAAGMNDLQEALPKAKILSSKL